MAAARGGAALQAALALCLLAVATAAPSACTAGSFQLDLVSTDNNQNDLARCLTSVRVNVDGTCKISLTPLNAGGNWVNGIWSGFPLRTYEHYVECPTVESAKVAPASTTPAAIQTAIAKAFEGHVYGYSGSTARNPLSLDASTPLTFGSGTVTVTRVGGINLVYAVTQSTVTASQIHPSLAVLPACSSLLTPATMCRNDTSSPDGAGSACPNGRYGVYVRTGLKVCVQCPAGTFGDGFSCQPCDAGSIGAAVGATTCPATCGAGKYSPGGSSICLPCPVGTYSSGTANPSCTPCPADSSAWLPGRSFCMRCVKGLPVECNGDDCGPNVSSPGSHIVSVGRLAACALNTTYEVKAYTKCSSWSQLSPAQRVMFAMEVEGDCSIDIKPIADPACADPTSTTGAAYGDIQLRAYYATAAIIRTRVPTETPFSKGLMMSIEAGAGANALTWTFFGASSNPADVSDAHILGQTRCIVTTPTVIGGQIVSKPAAAVTQCPARSYFVQDGYCYACPTGSQCAGGAAANSGPRTLCAAGTANPLLGGNCTACASTVTSVPGSSACSVPAVNQTCAHATIGQEWDLFSQACVPCAAGTRRNDTTLQCEDCPAGTFSAQGAKTCTPCPPGQFNPGTGLADQSSITPGIKCLLCANGSLALTYGTANAVTGTLNVTGATFCDACSAGTFFVNRSTACAPCREGTFRSGDATPTNNVCKNIPAGFKIKPANAGSGVLPRAEVVPCEAGKVSSWADDLVTRTPANASLCIACSALGPSMVNTYAPRQGMMKCIPCPAGQMPVTTGGNTLSCTPCPAGQYRTANMLSCAVCGTGKEAGPYDRSACSSCDPGFFMNSTMVAASLDECQPCPKNTYRDTYGSSSCLPCPRGTETQDTGNAECTECPIGFYNNGEGRSCQPAPAGTYTNVTAALTPTACPKGTWNNETGQDSCDPCPPGKFSNNLGARDCKTCAAGTYSGTQAIACLDCRPGFSSSPGSATCVPCKAGFYAPNNRTESCLTCPRGFQCPTAGMLKEGPCPRGTYSNREGNSVCSPCPVNNFSLGGGNSTIPVPVFSCTACDPGFNTRGLAGQSQCQPVRPQTRRTLL